MAHVCPIHKSGERSKPSNHRPVTLVCNPEIYFERVVFIHFLNHLNTNKILTSLQSGFIPGDSTVNQLIYLYNMFCQALDSGKEIRGFFVMLPKRSNVFGMRDLYLSLKPLESLVVYLHGFVPISQIENRGLCFQVFSQDATPSGLGYSKDIS